MANGQSSIFLTRSSNTMNYKQIINELRIKSGKPVDKSLSTPPHVTPKRRRRHVARQGVRLPKTMSTLLWLGLRRWYRAPYALYPYCIMCVCMYMKCRQCRQCRVVMAQRLTSLRLSTGSVVMLQPTIQHLLLVIGVEGPNV